MSLRLVDHCYHYLIGLEWIAAIIVEFVFSEFVKLQMANTGIKNIYICQARLKS